MSVLSTRFRHRFGTFDLDAAFEVPAAGIIAMLGPSGAGKSTILRCIAGLVRATGRLQLDNDIWQDETIFVPPHRRPVGYVFQDANLFPHLSVTGNLTFGLRRATRSQTAINFDEIVPALGLQKLLHRGPTSLSGGERQRVALGRALLSQPRILLFDEPLSGLDSVSKQTILPYLQGLPGRFGLPALFVSHDLAEVVRVADHLVLVESGRIIGTGPLQEVLTRLDLPIARADEASSVLRATVSGFDHAYGLCLLSTAGGLLQMPGSPLPVGSPLRVRVIATDVTLSRSRPAGTTVLNIFQGRIEASAPAASHQVNVVLSLAPDRDDRLLARITQKSWDTLGFAPGETVFALVKAASLASHA